MAGCPGCEFQMPSTTVGAHSVMVCWTAIATMQQPVSLEERVPFATMLCEACCSLGQGRLPSREGTSWFTSTAIHFVGPTRAEQMVGQCRKPFSRHHAVRKTSEACWHDEEELEHWPIEVEFLEQHAVYRVTRTLPAQESPNPHTIDPGQRWTHSSLFPSQTENPTSAMRSWHRCDACVYHMQTPAQIPMTSFLNRTGHAP